MWRKYSILLFQGLESSRIEHVGNLKVSQRVGSLVAENLSDDHNVESHIFDRDLGHDVSLGQRSLE